MRLIGVDEGGASTDLIYPDTETNETAIHKVPTTPDDPSVGAIAGIEALCGRLRVDPHVIDHVLYATTIATIAVLGYEGAKAGDELVLIGPSGGGYGNPPERDSMCVVKDVRDGYLSLERPYSDYGVVVTPTLELDAAATEALRQELRAN